MIIYSKNKEELNKKTISHHSTFPLWYINAYTSGFFSYLEGKHFKR